MIILCLFIIFFLFLLIKLILYLIVKKYGKFSYDGFSAVGFAYNSEKDIFYSTKNAWQKNFGYTRLYDVLAPICRMIIDTEPVRFYYNNKNWLITFWKGQYGIVTGAEIGIYCTTEQKINKKTIYFPVSDDEMPHMYLILYKKGEFITKVNAKHWWLAIFKLSMFSWPNELSMDIVINFPTIGMLNAFLESFKNLGYTSRDYITFDNTFYFKYLKPHTPKVWTRNWFFDNITQLLNHKNVKLYNKYLDKLIDDNKIDDTKKTNNKNLVMLSDFIPDFLKNKLENEQNAKQIASNILDKNIAFINYDLLSKAKVNRHD